jgi:transcriptional regulator with XRE-family HTH domain
MNTLPTKQHQTLEEVKALLHDRNLSVVAAATNLNPQTIYRLVRGKVKPHNSTLRLLSEYLRNG